jgi:hypothetical protein
MPAFDVKIVSGRFVTCHPMGERRPTDVTFMPDPRTPRVPKYADLETHDNSLISYALTAQDQQ